MAQKEQPTANRNYKDTVFRMLFSDRKNLLSLYNAVSGSHYDDPEKLEIITLENAIYMGMKNDLAFIIDTELFLYEHQSTYNPNMPLRDLFYISSEYQKLVDKKSLYSSVLQKIPAPQFIVFYNGTEKKKDSWVNHLSEAFENLSGNPKLELEVLTININEGHNSELMEQCQTLREYAQYTLTAITVQVLPFFILFITDIFARQAKRNLLSLQLMFGAFQKTAKQTKSLQKQVLRL